MAQAGQESNAVEFYPSADVWVEENGKVFLVGDRCGRCGKLAFPRRSFCDNCGNVEGFEPVRLSDTGTLYSFSEVHVAPRAFKTPYVIGYVDMPGDVRVFGQVENSAADLRLDEPVEVVLGVIRTSEDGRPVVSYKFRKQGGSADA